MRIKLANYDVFLALEIGGLRNIQSIVNGMIPKVGVSSWDAHVEGAAGEIAVARLLNEPWTGALWHFHEKPDVGDLYEVRTTKHQAGHLLVYKQDSDEFLYVLVTGAAPRFDVRGYIKGSAAKQVRWWNAELVRPGYFVPQSELLPIEELVPSELLANRNPQRPGHLNG